jgi:hypothetical protein
MNNKKTWLGQYSTKHLIFAALLITLIGWVMYRYFTAPPAGFCVAQNRFIPDEVFIKQAAEEAILERRKFDGKHFSLINCCVVRRLNGNFWLKIFRVDSGVWVLFAYEKSTKIKEEETIHGYASGKDRYSWGGGYFDSCGNHRDWDNYDGIPFGGAAYKEGKGELPPTLNDRDLNNFVKWPKPT